MKKILFLISIITVFLLASSCRQEGVKYELGDKIEVSFPSTIVNFSMVAADGNKITVEMWRGNTVGAATVPVTITDKTGGIFTPEKNQFDFADGENKAYLTFTYPDLSKFGGEKYEIELAVTDDTQVSPNGNEKMKITAQRKLTFRSLGVGTFTSEFYEDSWPQEVQKAEEADYYRLPDCYYKGYPIEFSVTDGKISFAKQPMGWNHSTYGMVSWDPKYLDYCEINGKVYTFAVNFVIPDGRSFGGYFEVLEMP